MSVKDNLYAAGVVRMMKFCALNHIPCPKVNRLKATDRLYYLATCAYYRAVSGITIMVEKTAMPGMGGRAWSWPGYAVDRTAYGVIQHELGHHVDHHFSINVPLFSKTIWENSKEKPLTGYLGTDDESETWFQEWFAEIFRLYVTNPYLCLILSPRFVKAMVARKIYPCEAGGTWRGVLESHNATQRIIDMAQKKIDATPISKET